MRRLLRRHTTLIAFSLSLGASTAFVACGSSDTNTTGTQPDAASGGAIGSGGATSSGGHVTSGGATSSGGASSGGASSGGASSGGAPTDSGSDAVSSNGDAQTD